MDADRVLLERIGVTHSAILGDSGDGIEISGDRLDYVAIRQCLSYGNR